MSAAPAPAHRPVAGVGGRRRIGLLGGSFNPAHEGHRHISVIALKLLKLQEIWWLVSPQNPLKPRAGMAPFAVRFERAARTARHPRIKVSDLEVRLGTRYTADTLAALRQRFPRLKFVWLMGADNLRQISGWQQWPKIFTQLSIAVFDRPSYAFKALAGRAARRFQHFRVGPRQAKRLAALGPPAWVFLHIPLHKASATAIRAAGGRPRAGIRKGERNHSTTPKKAVHPR